MQIPIESSNIDIEGRIKMTVSCKDCQHIPKVENAGQYIIDDHFEKWQVLFNGIEVKYGGYYGEWMARIIRELKGHHEPQEEFVFYKVLERMPANATMIELGCFWAYYSIWFAKVIKNAQLFLCEPDPIHLELAKKNLTRNGIISVQTRQCGSGFTGEQKIFLESENSHVPIKSLSVPDLIKLEQIEFVDLLHFDIQGAETDVIETLRKLNVKDKIRFVFVSTHHYRISGDPLTHQKCLYGLKQLGAYIICEHSVEESYSGDGLIVASFQDMDKDFKVNVSYNRASNALFRPLNFDLAECLSSRQ